MNRDLPLAFTYPDEYFNVCDTLECGQIFRYKRLSECEYQVYSLDKYAVVAQEDGVVKAYTRDAEYFWNFFDLDTDYAQKVKRISAISPVMMRAAQLGKGIRILNQDLTETIFSFIISANNNIKRIQLIIERMCGKLGRQTEYGRAFPTVQSMAEAPVQLFTDVGAGYRDRYLSETAKGLLSYDLSALSSMPSDLARKQLLNFKGIGPKVADCILLFGMRRGDVVPVDTWIKKAYHAYFEQGHADKDISGYLCRIFGGDAGLCQQYLFYFERKYGQHAQNIVQ